MQSDKFDKKIREAAEHHHPSYNEKAWDNMEKLLDKHLPQKEERKRRFLFILLFLLLLGGSGAWLMLSKPWKDKEPVAANQTLPAGNDSRKDQQRKGTGSSDGITPTATNADKASGENNTHTDNVTPLNIPAKTTPVTPVNKATSDNQDKKPVADQQNRSSEKNVQAGDFNASSVAGAKGKRNRRTEEQKNNRTEEQVNRRTDEQKNNRTNEQTNKEPKKEELVKEEHKNIGTDEQKNNRTEEQVNRRTEEQVNNRTEEQKNNRTDEQVNKEPKKEDLAAGKKEETNKKKETSKKPNSLFFSVSTGPDISFVGTGNSSKLKIVTGLGLGYTIRDRFTIRTGFYSARKIYSAKPSDYKAPPEFYQFYPYLEKVDADCKVYEIPVLLSYNFGKQSNWFVTAGLSTFLMNEESYNYFYKYTPTGNTYTNRWTIKNENAHFFSVGTLSAGYKRNFGKRVSFMAEPYLKVPFGGVGYGKVKLNSGGVLFSVGIKVF